MSDVLIVSGPPGAGKSTVAALLLDAFPRVALVPGDHFFAFWARGALLPWLPEAHEQNTVITRSAAAAAATLAAGGCPVVYDGVVGPWLLPTFVQEAIRHGLKVPGELHLAVLLPSLARCRQQVAERVGHGFTDAAATTQMHDDFTAAVPELAGRHVLADVADQPNDVAAELLQRYRAGNLRYTPGG